MNWFQRPAAELEWLAQFGLWATLKKHKLLTPKYFSSSINFKQNHLIN